MTNGNNNSKKSINDIKLPRPEDLKPVNNEEAEEMMRVGRQLVEMALRQGKITSIEIEFKRTGFLERPTWGRKNV